MSDTNKPQLGEIVSRENLSPEELADLELATQTRENAYAPYSHFQVGSVLRMNNGEIAPGRNFETIVHFGVHAEPSALTQTTVAGRESGLKRITVVGGPENQGDYDEPTICCGLCRQMLLEILKPEDDPDIIAAGIKGNVLKVKLRELVPLPFYPEGIAQKYPRG